MLPFLPCPPSLAASAPSNFVLTPGSTTIKATWEQAEPERLTSYTLSLLANEPFEWLPVQAGATERSHEWVGLRSNHHYYVTLGSCESPISLPGWGCKWAGFAAGSTTTTTSARWQPTKGLTWYWQLNGPLPAMTGTGAPAKATAWLIDGESTTAAQVAALHAAGHKAVCYVDVGTAENWREDYSSFPAGVKGGELAEWPGEYFSTSTNSACSSRS